MAAALGGRNAVGAVAIVAAFGAAVALLLGVVVYLQTPDGAVRIEILNPEVRVTIAGGKATFTGATKNHKIVLHPGPHGITITRGDLTFGTTSFELKEGDKPRLRIEYIAGKVHVTKYGDRRLNAPQRASQQHFLIGNRFGGRIRDVQLSKVARYEADFKPQDRVTPDEHTLALYHFDEGKGDVLTDVSGNNHHGKIVRAKWVPSKGTSSSAD